MRARIGLILHLWTGLALAQPWWDNYPRIVLFTNQGCDSRLMARAVELNADIAGCTAGNDPTVGIWAQRVSLLEESERGIFAKMRAAGLRTQAYFESFGEAKGFIMELRRNPDGSWVKSR